MRILGKTGLEVYEVGLGGIPLQRINEEITKQIIQKMHQLGMNFIDTARAYTNSEALLGQALRNLRTDFIVATKSMAKTYEEMKSDIEKSLTNLQTNYIDIYQIHNPKEGTNLAGPLKALEEAKQEGKVRHIGITNHSAPYLLKLIKTYDFATIQFPYNFLEAQGEELFKYAQQNNIGTIVMKPLGGGVIDRGDLALKYIMKNPHISVAIPGMASLEEVKQNYNYSKGEYTQEELDYMADLRNKTEKDFCHRCGYCLPCKQGIDIPLMFTFANYYTKYGLIQWAKDRYNSLLIKADACIECGLCETKCPYQLHIINKLKKVNELFRDH